MINKEIDIERIKQLLEQVPEDVDIQSIDLSEGYKLNMVYSLQLHSKAESELILAELQAMFKELDNTFEKYNQNQEGKP